MKTRLGSEFDTAQEYPSVCAALVAARHLDGPGSFWAFRNHHWSLVGNYLDGVVYNGASQQLVQATVNSVVWAARNAA